MRKNFFLVIFLIALILVVLQLGGLAMKYFSDTSKPTVEEGNGV